MTWAVDLISLSANQLIRPFKKCFSFQKKILEIFLSAWSANQLIRSVDQIIQKMFFFSRIFFRKKNEFFFISWSDQLIRLFKKCFSFQKKIEKKNLKFFLSADQIIQKMFFFKNFFLEKSYQPISWKILSANQLIRSVDQIIQKMFFFSKKNLEKNWNKFYQLISLITWSANQISWSDHSKNVFLFKKKFDFFF